MNLRLKSSELDKWLDPKAGSYKFNGYDDSYIDKALYKLFFVDVINQIKVKAAMAKQFHIAPSEIDRMAYWEYELWMKEINNQVNEENDMQQDQLDKYHVNDLMSSVSSGKFMKNMMPESPKMPAMPKMPSFGTMKTPF